MRISTSVRLAGVLLASLLAVSACASPEGNADTGEEKETRSVTDATGAKIKVPKEPERIVALSEQDLDSLLALDITPVGTVNGRGQKTPPAYLGDKAADIEVVGDVGKPTVDKIVELDPDLVLFGGAQDEKQLEKLRELVPATVVTYKLDDEWTEAFTKIADVVGAKKDGETWLTEYESKVEEAQGKLGDNAKSTVSIVRWNPDGPGIMQNEAFASLVIQDLGLKRPKDQQEPGFAHTDPLSLENLPRIDADWLFVGTLQPGAEKALKEAKKDSAFSELDAVKKDHFVEVDGTLWTSRGGPLASLQVIDDVVKNLGKK
ncbi:ABC transporter substrate-binding protein [Stackebrandtia nassauensis]|uniref:Periplasmic binding protein n=1 Tax=Stackebrandtia nassauensis (strain DSM 44728 / CIP 108903 / NRRL B-16338 / NBRC 102104 / LLR-40K-21) TaxID=446470 RepID=D3Q5A6_STANL|nr:ABC transporter substrate-binding protein [Stackebrandtia nassauensis]ADD44155.1 periplasmic binding protein [Stackebrandtia nassauensis DSM 44728]